MTMAVKNKNPTASQQATANTMQAPPPPQQPHYPGRPHPPPTMMSSSVATGKTPVAKRTRASRRAVANNDPPPPATNHSNNISVVPPPQQQQQSHHQPAPPQIMRNAADDAIAKRRAELRRLQQQRGMSDRLSQAQAAAVASSKNHRGAPMMTMRSAVATTNNNQSLSRFKTASMASSAGGNAPPPLKTARRLNESYQNNNNAVTANNNNTTAAVRYNNPGPSPPQQKLTNASILQSPAAATIPSMAVKRTSEIFPPKRGSSTASSVRQQSQNINTNIASPAMTTMPSNGGGAYNNGQQYHQQQHQQGLTKPPPKQQNPPQQQQQQSPSLNSIQSSSSSTNNGNSSKSSSVKSSPFGQARVTKVIPALSLSGTNTSIGVGGIGGGVKSLVPPLNMLDPPPLLDEADVKNHGAVVDGGVTAVKTMPLKSVEGTKQPPPIKANIDVVTNTTNVKMTTPRQNDKDEEGEVINSGQSTPIHTNHKDESPRESVVAAADNGDSNGVDATLLYAATVGNELIEQTRKAVIEQNVDNAKIAVAVTTTNDDVIPKDNEEEEEVENHQPPQSKKEQEINHETTKEDNNTYNGKNINLSRLKLDLERSEKEKLEALEQVAKLKSLLEASGVGSSNGETPRSSSLDQMSTIDTPRRVTTPRKGGGYGGMTTPRGGNTPNRFTPSRSRAGVPPLAWGTPRSGNSRAGSRTGSPEHGHHHYGMMSGTPRVRASPLPKQLNRVVSDTQLNKKAEGDNADAATSLPQEERVEEEFLAAAAKSIPNEYGTPLASYFVRRPHVTDDNLEKNETDEMAKVAIDLWDNKCTHLSSSDEYKKHASVFQPASLEVVACIEADGSVFTLSGECNVRHGKVSTMFDEDDANIAENEYDWSVFDNVEEMDRALGRVSYIDEEGNEREYWLDEIYEEALTTRESYCTSMISAAFTLKEVRGPLAQKREQPASWNQTMQSQPTQMQSFAPPKSTLNGSVNMMSHPPLNQQNVPQSNANVPQNQSQRSEPTTKVEMPTNSVKKEPLTSETTSKASSTKEESKQQKQSPPPEEYEPSDSALTVMVVALFSLFFKLSWLVIKTPFRIASMILTFWIMLIAVRVLCLFFADDNGAWDVGAGVEYEYNMPGIY